MRSFNFRNVMLVLAIVAMVGVGATAFAGWGRGWGHGPGYHHGGWGGSGYGPGAMMGNLSDEEIKALEEERQAFFKDTEKIRQELYSKELELRSEMGKENPDAAKAASLQTEISKLEAQLDQKRVDHMIKMRKLNPNAGRGYMMGRGGKGYGRGGMGYGPGGGGMGYGPGYGGGCWR